MSNVRQVESGIKIWDAENNEWMPFEYLFTIGTQNEDNTMKYRVTTNVLKDFDIGDVIVRGSNGDQFVKEGNDIPGYPALMDDWVERNPDWFEPVEEVQVGTYWKECETETIYRIESHDTEHGLDWKAKVIGETDHDYASWDEASMTRGCRKLFTEEIEQALDQERKRRGLVDGVRIKEPSTRRNPDKGKVSGNGKHYAPSVDQLAVGGRTVYMQGEFAQVVDQTPHIEINGYEAEFCEDYVKFGCAKIDKAIFQDLWTLFKPRSLHEGDGCNGNRVVEGIKIGEGVFTIDQIKTIAEYYE